MCNCEHRTDDGGGNRSCFSAKRCLLLLVICLLAYACFSMTVFVLSIIVNAGRGYHGWGDATFDSEEWKAVEALRPDSPRGTMVSDLLDNHELIGLTREQVRELLGDPEEANTSRGRRAHPVETAPEWIYYLGMYSGFRIDEDILVIKFDANDRVKRWWVRQT